MNHMKSRAFVRSWLLLLTAISSVSGDNKNALTELNTKEVTSKQQHRHMIKNGEALSPTDLAHTSPPTGPPIVRPPVEEEVIVPELQQNSFMNDDDIITNNSANSPASSLPFACIPPQIFRICTAPDSEMGDECVNVGEPCGTFGSSPDEHCCVDYCGRKYCTAKSWFTLDESESLETDSETAQKDDSVVFGFIGTIHNGNEDQEVEKAVELDLDNSNNTIMPPTPHPTKKPRVGRTRRPSRGGANKEGESPGLVQNEAVELPTLPPLPQLEQHEFPTQSPNNNLRATVPPTIIVTRPESQFPTLPGDDGSDTDFPTLPPAPFFVGEPTESPAPVMMTSRPTPRRSPRPTPRRPNGSDGSDGSAGDAGGIVSYPSKPSYDGGGGWNAHHSSSTKSRKAGKRGKSGKGKKWGGGGGWGNKSGKGSSYGSKANHWGNYYHWQSAKSSKSGKSSKSSPSWWWHDNGNSWYSWSSSRSRRWSGKVR